jgi:hypothetical protein
VVADPSVAAVGYGKGKAMGQIIEIAAEQLQVGDVWVADNGSTRTITRVDMLGATVSVELDGGKWEPMSPDQRVRVRRDS